MELVISETAAADTTACRLEDIENFISIEKQVTRAEGEAATGILRIPLTIGLFWVRLIAVHASC